MILAAIVLFGLAAALGLWLVVLGVHYRRGSRSLVAGRIFWSCAWTIATIARRRP